MESTDDLGSRKNFLEIIKIFPTPVGRRPPPWCFCTCTKKIWIMYVKSPRRDVFFNIIWGTILKIPCHIFLGPKLPVDPISAV